MSIDKFYTNKDYSKKCIKIALENENFDFIIEPSAGDGSFLHQLPENIDKIGIDIEPDSDGIKQGDFLKYKFPENKNKILVIGNPPFGKISSLAVKFFNHSASCENVDTIAFIVPRTFRKISIQNKLNLFFNLVYDEDTPTKPCCFTPRLQVKCCFQIWKRHNNTPRLQKIPSYNHMDWDFVKLGPKDIFNQPTVPVADFAIRAYGGKIGEIKLDMVDLRPKSWHWIKSKQKSVSSLIEIFSQLDYSGSLNTARQNSMGKAELVQLYTNYCNFVNSKI